MLQNNYLPAMVLAPFLLAAAPSLIAHDDDHRRDDRRYSDRYRNSYSDRTYRRANPVDLALRDLNSIRSRSRVDDHESKHFRRATEELLQFDERARRGKFDRGSLDDAIDNMEHLAQARQIHPRDRARLRDHLFALRALRSRGDWR